MAHLNINQMMGKFNALKEIIQGNLDILAITESKLDQSYPANMFDIEGYTQPFRILPFFIRFSKCIKIFSHWLTFTNLFYVCLGNQFITLKAYQRIESIPSRYC